MLKKKLVSCEINVHQGCVAKDELIGQVQGGKRASILRNFDAKKPVSKDIFCLVKKYYRKRE